MAGNFHVHLPVNFSDGVKWLARIRKSTEFLPLGSDKAHAMTKSEIATQRFLHSKGLKVPNAWITDSKAAG